MLTRAWIPLLIAYFLFLGSSCGPSFRASWYIINKDPGPQSETHIVILNESSDEQTIRNVVLNPKERKEQASRWQLNKEDDKSKYIRLMPGEVLSRPVTSFERDPKNREWQCRVPLNVVIVTESETPIRTLGAMPSALPEEWEKVCPKR